MFIDTLHPIHEGRVFRWERDKPEATVSEYGRSTEGEAAERWRRSPHYRLLETGESLMRRSVTAETEREFALFPALWEGPITEFVATVNRFSVDGVIGEMDCFYTGWMTEREGGRRMGESHRRHECARAYRPGRLAISLADRIC